MIAYVIKNKEGKYYNKDTNMFETPNFIYNEHFYEEKWEAENDIKYRNLFLCKVVEITIKEVNENLTPTNYDNLSIEDKLKYREIQVRIARDRDVEYNDKITELEFTIKRLEEELAEKDKEIDTLNRAILRISNEKANIIQREQIDYLSFAKEIRKQVCDEIREKCIYIAGTKQICPNTSISTYDLNEILDQIEKGEE